MHEISSSVGYGSYQNSKVQGYSAKKSKDFQAKVVLALELEQDELMNARNLYLQLHSLEANTSIQITSINCRLNFQK